MRNHDKPDTALLERWQRDHLQFQGREPRTLAEVAVAEADAQHRRRLAEIKTVSAKLALLDAFVEPLALDGVRIGCRHFLATDGGKTLRLHATLGAGTRYDARLHAALLGLGFREVERHRFYPNAPSDVVKLRHGRALTIELEVPRAEPDGQPPARVAAPTAEARATPAAVCS